LIIQIIDNIQPGGAQEILRCLALYGPRCKVYSVFGEDGACSTLKDAGVGCETIAPSKRLLPLALARLAWMAGRWPRNTVVNAHLDLATVALCALRRVFRFRLVVTVHALQAQWPRWYVRLFRASIGAADHVVVEDQIARREVIDCGVSPDKVTLIPIGTDKVDQPRRPADVDVRQFLGIPAGRPILLNIGRMVVAKGQAHLIQALAHARRADTVAVIVGDGPQAGKLRALANELNVADRVFFPGVRTDLHNFYTAATALVMPCLDESMGVVIYEALAYGLPVIAYRSGSIEEVIKDGVNGFLVHAEPTALADKLDWLLDERPVLDFSGVAEHSARTMCERYGRVYARVSGDVR
jgi:glycosyltransferase involved in cell wall biosynthesis